MWGVLLIVVWILFEFCVFLMDGIFDVSGISFILGLGVVFVWFCSLVFFDEVLDLLLLLIWIFFCSIVWIWFCIRVEMCCVFVNCLFVVMFVVFISIGILGDRDLICWLVVLIFCVIGGDFWVVLDLLIFIWKIYFFFIWSVMWCRRYWDVGNFEEYILYVKGIGFLIVLSVEFVFFFVFVFFIIVLLLSFFFFMIFLGFLVFRNLWCLFLCGRSFFIFKNGIL